MSGRGRLSESKALARDVMRMLTTLADRQNNLEKAWDRMLRSMGENSALADFAEVEMKRAFAEKALKDARSEAISVKADLEIARLIMRLVEKRTERFLRWAGQPEVSPQLKEETKP